MLVLVPVMQVGHNPMLAGVAGAVATAFNDAIMTPVDVIKQRLQVRLLRLSCVGTPSRRLAQDGTVSGVARCLRRRRSSTPWAAQRAHARSHLALLDCL